MDELIPRGLGRVVTWNDSTAQWNLSGGCWAISEHDVVTNHHVVHEVVWTTKAGASTSKGTWIRTRPENRGTRKWKALNVQVLTQTQRSTATIVRKSKKLDFAILHCPTISFTPLPVILQTDRFMRIVHCHYPIARDLGPKPSLTLSLDQASKLDWSLVSSEGTIAGSDKKNHSVVSNYQAFPGSCGFPVLRWSYDECVWMVCGMHVSSVWHLAASEINFAPAKSNTSTPPTTPSTTPSNSPMSLPQSVSSVPSVQPSSSITHATSQSSTSTQKTEPSLTLASVIPEIGSLSQSTSSTIPGPFSIATSFAVLPAKPVDEKSERRDSISSSDASESEDLVIKLTPDDASHKMSMSLFIPLDELIVSTKWPAISVRNKAYDVLYD